MPNLLRGRASGGVPIHHRICFGHRFTFTSHPAALQGRWSFSFLFELAVFMSAATALCLVFHARREVAPLDS
jgi:hypothetical protein